MKTMNGSEWYIYRHMNEMDENVDGKKSWLTVRLDLAFLLTFLCILLINKFQQVWLPWLVSKINWGAGSSKANQLLLLPTWISFMHHI